MTRENWRTAWRAVRRGSSLALVTVPYFHLERAMQVYATRKRLQRPGTLPVLWLPVLDRLPRRQAAAFRHGWDAARRGDPLPSCKHGPGDSRRGPWRWGWLAWATARGRG